METKQERNSHLVEKLKLENLGFQYIAESEGYDNLYKLDNQNATLYIYFRIEIDRLYILGGWLQLHIVENILNPLLEKFNFSYPQIATISSTQFLPDGELHRALNEAQATPLESEKSLEIVAKLMRQYIEGVFIPFGERYSDLQVVNDEIIDKVPDIQITDYIMSYASFKKMIIMKLCSNSGYEAYKNWLFDGLKKRYEEGRNQNYYLLLIELIDVLKKM